MWRPPGRVLRVAWSPDGRRLAVRATGGVAVFTYPVKDSAEPEQVIDPGGVAKAIAWSPDGDRLAVAGQFLLRVWNVEKGDWEDAATKLEAAPQCLAWSRDGQLIAVGHGGGTVWIHDADERKTPWTLTDHKEGVLALAWSPDGRVLASGSKEGTIILWDIEGRKSRHDFPHSDRKEAVTDLTWLDDGRRLASASHDGTAALWDMKDLKSPIRLTHPKDLTSVSASFDGRFLATKSLDGTVRLWRAATGVQVAVLPEPTLGRSLPNAAFHPSESILTTIGEGDEVVRLWRLDPTVIANASIDAEAAEEAPVQETESPAEDTDPPAREVKTAKRPAPQEASILAANVHDVATAKDALGFTPYVRAVADFLTHKRTEPPLTLSVEGAWGAGKSSFMLQLQEELEKRGHPCIDFNPWRLSRREEVWAAFALHFVREAPKRPVKPRGWAERVQVLLGRYDWRRGRPEVTRAAAWAGGVVAAGLAVLGIAVTEGPTLVRLLADSVPVDALWREAAAWILGGSGLTAYAVGVKKAWVRVKKAWERVDEFARDPLEVDLEAYVRSPQYEARTSFLERFHDDFRQILDAFVGPASDENPTRVYVFIDDLDRCEVPKASDLMQAINLMIPEDPRLVFVIGMDREKVAAGLAVKYERVLPYIAASEGIADPRDPKVGLRFGYNFIEKFVQIPFIVPQPTLVDVRRLLDKLSPVEAPAVADAGEEEAGDAPVHAEDVTVPPSAEGPEPSPASALPEEDDANGEAPEAAPVEDVEEAVTPEQEARRERFRLGVTSDSEGVRKLVLMAAPTLDYNPRRIKQYLNLLRLRVFIASNTGLFDDPGDGSEPLTLEQFGKFVAISIRWPLFLLDVGKDPVLLAALQKLALGEHVEASHNLQNPIVSDWANRPKLMNLLRHGVKDAPDEETARRHSMEGVRVERLLQVSPAVSGASEFEDNEEARSLEVKAGSRSGGEAPRDLILSFEPRDEKAISALAEGLQERGISVWLDRDEADARVLREFNEQLLGGAKGLVVVVGPGDFEGDLGVLRRTHALMARGWGLGVVVALLPGVEEIPDLMRDLGEFPVVRFTGSMVDPEVLDALVRLVSEPPTEDTPPAA